MDIFQKQTIYNIIFYIIIPLAIPTLIYLIKPKYLWISPLIAVVSGIIFTLVYYPGLVTDISSDTSQMFWGLGVSGVFLICGGFTGIIYLGRFIRKLLRKRNLSE